MPYESLSGLGFIGFAKGDVDARETYPNCLESSDKWRKAKRSLAKLPDIFCDHLPNPKP